PRHPARPGRDRAAHRRSAVTGAYGKRPAFRRHHQPVRRPLNMVKLRPVLPADIDALYEICLVTGDAGADASALYTDPRLLGQIYAAPYAALEPAHTLVAEDAEGVAGYLVGTHDTAAFAA